MFAQLAVVLALAAAAVAHPSHRSAPSKTCNAGNLQCCNQVQTAQSIDFSKIYQGDIYELFPDLAKGANIPVGLTCSPLLDLVSAQSCNQQTVCCDGGHFSGLISVNCNAFNLGAQGLGNLIF